MSISKEAHDRICKELVDRGRLIEAGFQGLRFTVIPDSVGEQQLFDMRCSFFAGAQHLFASIMSVLEAGEEATPNDLRRMDLIATELNEFYLELKKGTDFEQFTRSQGRSDS